MGFPKSCKCFGTTNKEASIQRKKEEKETRRTQHTTIGVFDDGKELAINFIIMGEKKVTETTNTQVSDVQPYVLHSPLVIAIEKFAWWRRRQVGLARGQKPGQIIHNPDGSITKVISVKAL